MPAPEAVDDKKKKKKRRLADFETPGGIVRARVPDDLEPGATFTIERGAAWKAKARARGRRGRGVSREGAVAAAASPRPSHPPDTRATRAAAASPRHPRARRYRVLAPPTLATQMLTVVLPEGYAPGDAIQVMSPAGPVRALVPKGLAPGDTFGVPYSVRMAGLDPPLALQIAPEVSEAEEEEDDDDSDADAEEEEPPKRRLSVNGLKTFGRRASAFGRTAFGKRGKTSRKVHVKR